MSMSTQMSTQMPMQIESPEHSFVPQQPPSFSRQNAYYLPVEEEEVVERSITFSEPFVWPTGTIVNRPIK